MLEIGGMTCTRAHTRVIQVCGRVRLQSGGGRGIRTPGTVSGPTVFKTAAIDRSAIPPHQRLEPHSSSHQERRLAVTFAKALTPYRTR